MKRNFLFAFTLITVGTTLLTTAADAQPARGRGGSPGGSAKSTLPTGNVNVETIQYFATLDRGLAEAKRTNRPILFVTGAPHCAGVSGMWCPGKGKIDENFLTKKEVIDASKKFVCIRLTSYENKAEEKFVEKITGVMVNTAFAILNPNGEPEMKLRGNRRGPADLFTDTADMVKQMNDIAAKYPVKDASAIPALPITLSAKVGMAVAAADLQPLLVVISADPVKRASYESQVAKLAWSSAIRGRMTYASAANVKEIPQLKGETISEGVMLIEPNYFGSGGDVVKKVNASVIGTSLESAISDTLKNHIRVAKSRQELKRKGLAEGIFYETGIPVSGTREAQDRANYKKQLDAKKSGG